MGDHENTSEFKKCNIFYDNDPTLLDPDIFMILKELSNIKVCSNNVRY